MSPLLYRVIEAVPLGQPVPSAEKWEVTAVTTDLQGNLVLTIMERETK